MKKIISTALLSIALVSVVNASIFGKLDPSEFDTQRTDAGILRLVPEDQRPAAKKVLQPVYEDGRRAIRAHKYGQAFPINPEILHVLMEQAPGKSILEIAGASGENSVLMGLSGAKKVYFNDIVPEEVAAFEKTVSTLGSDQQEKFETVPGDCFLLGDRMEPNSVEIVYAKNVFHFFRESRYEDFFTMVKKVLAPGGLFAMTVNSRFCDPKNVRFPENVTRFTTETLIIDIDGGNSGPQVVDRVIRACDEDKDPTEYSQENVARFSKTIRTGRGIYPQAMGRASPEMQEIARDMLKQNRTNTALINKGANVRVLNNTSMMFTPENLGAILERYGFEIVHTGHIGPDGHLIPEQEANETGALLVSLIARLPDDA